LPAEQYAQLTKTPHGIAKSSAVILAINTMAGSPDTDVSLRHSPRSDTGT
jgi:hypothetical protein